MRSLILVLAVVVCGCGRGTEHLERPVKAAMKAEVEAGEGFPKSDRSHWQIETPTQIVDCWGKPKVEAGKVTFRDWFTGDVKTITDTVQDVARVKHGRPEWIWKDGKASE